MSGEERIVVGVDGSARCRSAARWAAGEAVRRGRSLHLVYADLFAQPLLPELPGFAWPKEQHAEVRAQVQHWLDSAREAALDEAPDVEVTSAMRPGRPVKVLVDESESAELLVVGERGLGGWSGMLAGSVAVAVAAHSRCATAVVRGDGPARSDGPVVVGIDAPNPRRDVLEQAFEVASMRGAPVEVVHTWHAVGVDTRWLRVGMDSEELQRSKDSWVEDVVKPVASKHPGVAVRPVVRPGAPSAVLLERSQQAQLVVVGTRGHGNVSGLLLGSTSQPVLHHAPSPVIAIPL
jgi:nucleotide-binding universal stress UspA family protein